MVLGRIEFLTVCLAVSMSGGSPRPPARVINGQYAAHGELPYQVELRQFDQHWCGGSILDATHILTAAHCVISNENIVSRPEDISVVAGVVDTNHRQDDNVYAVSEITYHQDYDPTIARSVSYLADVAVLKLARPIQFNHHSRSINLASSDPPLGASAVASGWGVTYYDGENSESLDWLQKVNMQLVSMDDCKAAHPYQIDDGQICALGASGSAVCYGDSGGPLVHNDELVGIISWGSGCIDKRPDVFTSVAYYKEWIDWAMKYH